MRQATPELAALVGTGLLRSNWTRVAAKTLGSPSLSFPNRLSSCRGHAHVRKCEESSTKNEMKDKKAYWSAETKRNKEENFDSNDTDAARVQIRPWMEGFGNFLLSK